MSEITKDVKLFLITVSLCILFVQGLIFTFSHFFDFQYKLLFASTTIPLCMGSIVSSISSFRKVVSNVSVQLKVVISLLILFLLFFIAVAGAIEAYFYTTSRDVNLVDFGVVAGVNLIIVVYCIYFADWLKRKEDNSKGGASGGDDNSYDDNVKPKFPPVLPLAQLDLSDIQKIKGGIEIIVTSVPIRPMKKEPTKVYEKAKKKSL